jgi:hypothetical protein
VSISKQILFGDDPRYDDARALLREHAREAVDAHPARLRGKRKGTHGGWCHVWEGAVSSAAKELGIQYIIINSRFAFRTNEDRDAVETRAEIIRSERLAERQKSSRP